MLKYFLPGAIAAILFVSVLPAKAAEPEEVPLPVAICAGGLGAFGAAVGAVASPPAAIAALLLCSIVIETEISG